MKISLFLQLANFFVRHTYFGSRELHFKPKFDPVAQTVQELDTNICAACTPRGDKPVFREFVFSFVQWIIFLISYTYFGSRVVHFKTKFDRLAQMVQVLGLNKRAAPRARGHTFFPGPARQSDLFHLMDCF